MDVCQDGFALCLVLDRCRGGWAVATVDDEGGERAVDEVELRVGVLCWVGEADGCSCRVGDVAGGC